MLFRGTHCPRGNRQMINGSLNSLRLVLLATPSDGGVVLKSKYNGAGNCFETQCFTDIGLCSEVQAERRLSISSIWSPSELWTRENTTTPAGRPRLLRPASWVMPCDGGLHCLQTNGRTGISYNTRSYFDILQSPSKTVNSLFLDYNQRHSVYRRLIPTPAAAAPPPVPAWKSIVRGRILVAVDGDPTCYYISKQFSPGSFTVITSYSSLALEVEFSSARLEGANLFIPPVGSNLHSHHVSFLAHFISRAKYQTLTRLECSGRHLIQHHRSSAYLPSYDAWPFFNSFQAFLCLLHLTGKPAQGFRPCVTGHSLEIHGLSCFLHLGCLGVSVLLRKSELVRQQS